MLHMCHTSYALYIDKHIIAPLCIQYFILFLLFSIHASTCSLSVIYYHKWNQKHNCIVQKASPNKEFLVDSYIIVKHYFLIWSLDPGRTATLVIVFDNRKELIPSSISRLLSAILTINITSTTIKVYSSRQQVLGYYSV